MSSVCAETKTIQRPRLNQTLDCFKLMAAIIVVLVHVKWPGKPGEVVTWLCRFAVPLFYAVAGYFSYQTKANKLAKRLRHIISLEFFGSVLYCLWGFAMMVYNGGKLIWYLPEVIPTREEVFLWVFRNVNPYAGHMWYLSAVAVCYSVVWAYVRFYGMKKGTYRPLYILGACLLGVYLILDEFSSLFGIHVELTVYRNAWFFGLPLFILGIFLREHQDLLIEKFHLNAKKLAWAMFASLLLSFVEWQVIGSHETYIGMMLLVACMLLFSYVSPLIETRFPRLGKLSNRFGSWTMVIYMVHLMLHQTYNMVLQPRTLPIWGAAEPWIVPLLILAASFLVAIVWERLMYWFKKLLPRKKTA